MSTRMTAARRKWIAETERNARLRAENIEHVYAECRRWEYTVTLTMRGTEGWTCRLSSPRRFAYIGRGKTQNDALEAAWSASLGLKAGGTA